MRWHWPCAKCLVMPLHVVKPGMAVPAQRDAKEHMFRAVKVNFGIDLNLRMPLMDVLIQSGHAGEVHSTCRACYLLRIRQWLQAGGHIGRAGRKELKIAMNLLCTVNFEITNSWVSLHIKCKLLKLLIRARLKCVNDGKPRSLEHLQV